MLNNLKKTIYFLFLVNTINATYSQEPLKIIEKEYKSKSYLAPDYYETVARYAQMLLINNKIDESFELLKREYKTAKKINDYGNFAYLKSIEALQYSAIGEKEKSKKSFQEAKNVIDRTENNNAKGYFSYAGGWLAIRNKNEIEAVDYFLKALKYYDLDTQTKNLARRKSVLYHQLSLIYAEWDDDEMQEKYTFKTLEHALQQENADTIFAAYMAVGYMYDQRLRKDSSNKELRNLVESNYLKAIKIYHENQMTYPSDLSYAATNLANLYIKYYPDSHIEKAREYALLAQNSGIINNEPNHQAAVLLILAQISIKENKKQEAKKQLMDALEILEQSIKKDLHVELSLYAKLIELEIENGNYKEALTYQKKYIDIFKYIYDSEKLEKGKKLEAEHERKLQQKELEKLQLLADKKEQKIKILNFQNTEREIQYNNLKLIEENQTKKLKLSELQAETKQQELRLARLETQTKNKDLLYYQERLSYKELLNKYYIITIISVVMILILVLFILRQRTKRMLEKDKTFKLAIEKEKQNSKISALTSLLDGQERERERLARDLHDGLGGLLSATKLQLSDFLEKKNETQNKELKMISDHIDFAINKLRKVSHNLMPDILLKYGLETAIKEFANRMKNNNLEFHVNFLSFKNTLETEKQLFVYRIIQELVNNAIKHAQPKNIIIQIVEEKNQYQITVEDDGKGFEVNNLEFKNSAGFINIKSRIQFLKGTFEIHSQKNLGTSFEFNFPKK